MSALKKRKRVGRKIIRIKIRIKMYRHYEAELTELNVVTLIVRQIPLIGFLRHFTLDLMYTRLFLAENHIAS